MSIITSFTAIAVCLRLGWLLCVSPLLPSHPTHPHACAGLRCTLPGRWDLCITVPHTTFAPGGVVQKTVIDVCRILCDGQACNGHPSGVFSTTSCMCPACLLMGRSWSASAATVVAFPCDGGLVRLPTPCPPNSCLSRCSRLSSQGVFRVT